MFQYEHGWLGFPLNDETRTPDLVGRFNHFEGGSIYWKPSISAHEVHGAIRDFWAQHGWERNPDLGYPISDEQAHGNDRFSDFENGVVYWHNGGTAAAVAKTDLLDASKTRAEMEKLIGDRIVAQLKAANSRVYIDKAPTIASVTDYTVAGDTVHNRQYAIALKIGYDVTAAPDPHTDITLNIRVELDRAAAAVTATITYWHVHTDVPWPTSWGTSASDINKKLAASFDPLVDVPQTIQPVPAASLGSILSMKVMPNGDFNTYIRL